jgi:hypothetical protein
MPHVEVSDELFAKLEANSAKGFYGTVQEIVEHALMIHLQDWGSVSYAGAPGNYYEVAYRSVDCLWDEFAGTANRLGLSVEQALAEIAKGHDGSEFAGKSAFWQLESLSHFLGDVPPRYRGQLTIDDWLSR